MPGGSAGSEGKQQPATDGEDYGAQVFSTAGNAERIFDIVESMSVSIKAHPDNNDVIFIGFDEDVTVGTGYPLGADQSVDMDLDVENQGVWGVAAQANDEVRFLVIS